jgi:hypothetical protein
MSPFMNKIQYSCLLILNHSQIHTIGTKTKVIADCAEQHVFFVRKKCSLGHVNPVLVTFDLSSKELGKVSLRATRADNKWQMVILYRVTQNKLQFTQVEI